ncbi:hypothetical protein WA158_001617 [Blastocystis sp. Blastoise]
MNRSREQLIKDCEELQRKREEKSQQFQEKREEALGVEKDVDLTQYQISVLNTVGEDCGEVISVLNDEEVLISTFSGSRLVINCKKEIDIHSLRLGQRITIDKSTHTLLRALPRQVNPGVSSMIESSSEPILWSQIGGLNDQIREVREVIELPLTKPEFFQRVGIKAPRGVLLYGPPGTGKTLLAKALATNMNATFLKAVATSIVEKYIGESSKLIREMFTYAREHAPCVIFLDEIDAIGAKRINNGTATDREMQRTLMELLNQMDGFNELDRVKIVMATNRPDILDPALLRPGRLDRKVEIPLPNTSGRKDILKIHSTKMTIKGEIDWDIISKLAEGFNGADLRNVCTEAGMFAVREEREYVTEDDFVAATRKLSEMKKLESTLEYKKV